MNQQRSLFDDHGACPECGGPVTIVDDVGPVGLCQKRGDHLILDRGRWHEFKSFFGGGKPARPVQRNRRRLSLDDCKRIGGAGR